MFDVLHRVRAATAKTESLIKQLPSVSVLRLARWRQRWWSAECLSRLCSVWTSRVAFSRLPSAHELLAACTRINPYVRSR